MDMVEKVARTMAPAFAEACSYWCDGLLWTACTRKAECACRHYAFEAARAAIAAMSGELLAHFQGELDSPALGAVEKYRVSVCMDDIQHLTGGDVRK